MEEQRSSFTRRKNPRSREVYTAVLHPRVGNGETRRRAGRFPTAIFSSGPEAVMWASDKQLGSTFLHEITARKRYANDYESRFLF